VLIRGPAPALARGLAMPGVAPPADVSLAGGCVDALRAPLPLVVRKENPGFLEKSQRRMKSRNEPMGSVVIPLNKIRIIR
jgi:hypothetical protein